MDKMQNLVSVVVPIYGVEPYIEECINSIIAQTYSNIEIILVNDGSKDKCPQICDQYAQEDTRIKVIHKVNGGLVSARKSGIAVAQGYYSMFVDGDDWIEADYIEKMICNAIENNADIVVSGFIGFCGDNLFPVSDDLENGVYSRQEIEKKICPIMLCNNRRYHNGVAPAVWNKLFKTSLLYENLMGIDERITIGEDVACTYPCIMHADRIVECGDIMKYHYRMEDESMTRKGDLHYIDHIERLFFYLEKVFAEFDSEVIAKQVLQYEAYMMLQDGIRNTLQLSLSKKSVLFIKLYRYNKTISESVFFQKVLQRCIEKRELYELWQWYAMKNLLHHTCFLAILFETMVRRVTNSKY